MIVPETQIFSLWLLKQLLTPSKRSQSHHSQVASSLSSSASGSTEDLVQMPEFESSSEDDKVILPAPRSALGLKIPPPLFIQDKQVKKFVRVLTCRESCEVLEEKQKKKEEEMQKRAEKKLRCEERKRK